MKNNIKPSPKLLSLYPAEIEKHIKDTYSNLSEKDRRLYAAIGALKLLQGGKTYIIRLLGCSKKRLSRGIDDLNNPNTESKNRIRKKGAGRSTSIETINNIDEVFLQVIGEHIAGDPMDEKIVEKTSFRKT